MSQRDPLQLYEGSQPDRLIVVFMGFIDAGRSHWTLYSALSAHGNVLMVSYPRDGFDARAVAKKVVEHITCELDPQPTEVVLVGASMGARVALEALSELPPNGPLVRGFVAINGVAGIDSITEGNRQLLELSLHGQGRRWRWLRGLNGLMTYAIYPIIDTINVWARIAKHGRIRVAEGVPRSEVRRNLRAMRFVPWSARLGQARYMASLSEFTQRAYEAVPLVYIQSQPDEFVKVGTGISYLMYFSRNGYIYQVPMPHCSFVEQRPRWEDALDEALTKLLASSDEAPTR